jgi:hypothetical protein
MKTNDVIQVEFTPVELESLNTNLVGLESVAKKHAPNLTAEDRQQFGSIQDRNKLMVNKGMFYMEQNPDIVPKFVDINEFKRDYEARDTIEKAIRRLDAIRRKLEDTKILLDYDNYQDVMAFYRAVRYLAKEKEEYAIHVYEELKTYFPGNKTSNSENEETEE